MVTASKQSDDTKTSTPQKTTPTESAITCKPKGVFELRGGIERYVKTFPEGGFWKGKNYLFDRYVAYHSQGIPPNMASTNEYHIFHFQDEWNKFQKDGTWQK